MAIQKVHADISFLSSISLSHNYADFPTNPTAQQIVIVGGVPYIYANLGSGYFSWFPMAVEQSSYVHSQAVPMTTWTIVHNLNSLNYGIFVYDQSHNLLVVNSTPVDENTIRVNLTSASSGSAVIFSVENFASSTLTSTDISVGGLHLTANTSGALDVNGLPLAYQDNVDILSSTLTANLASEVSRATAAEGAIAANVASEVARALAAEALLAPKATTYTKTQVDTAIASSTPSFPTLTGKPTTLAGYGITDASTIASTAAAILVETNRAEAAEHALDVTHSADIASLTTIVNTKAPLASPTFSGTVTGITKAMVGLGNVDNTSDANKPVSGATITAIAVETARAETSEGTLLSSLTAETNRALAAETLLAPISYVNSQIGLLSFSGSLLSNFSANTIHVSGDIMPAVSGVSNIGSPTDKFAAINTKELHIDANTLYVDGVPVIGSSSNTIQITADFNQGLALSTTGTGQTILNSQTATVIQTNGVNADVNIQTAGIGSVVRMTSTTGVVITTPTLNVQGDQSISGGLTVAGNLTINGTTTSVNSTTLNVRDNIATFNKGEAGSGVSLRYSGIEVDRGDLARERLVWDETVGKWVAGQTAQEVALATEPFVISAISTATAGVTASTLGLGNVSNTSDANKPISTAQATAIALKASVVDLTAETIARTAADLLLAPQATTYTKAQVDTAIASATPSFSGLIGKPTTIAGYGIVDAISSAMVSAAVSTETVRATAAEGTLTTNLTSEVSNRINAITAEVSARNAAIAVESSRATTAEGVLSTAVTLKADIATTYTKTEVDAAIAAAIAAFALTLYV